MDEEKTVIKQCDVRQKNQGEYTVWETADRRERIVFKLWRQKPDDQGVAKNNKVKKVKMKLPACLEFSLICLPGKHLVFEDQINDISSAKGEGSRLSCPSLLQSLPYYL